jgi:hypothetical protein
MDSVDKTVSADNKYVAQKDGRKGVVIAFPGTKTVRRFPDRAELEAENRRLRDLLIDLLLEKQARKRAV